jgi:4-hydroxymandelate synthase
METAFVEIYVDDLAGSVREWTEVLSFEQVAVDTSAERGCASVALRQGRIGLVLTQGLVDDHPAQLYVGLYGTGVAQIALRTPDAAAAHAASLGAGARPAPVPDSLGGSQACAGRTVSTFGDVVHSYVDGGTARDVTGVAAVLLGDGGAATPDATDRG